VSPAGSKAGATPTSFVLEGRTLSPDGASAAGDDLARVRTRAQLGNGPRQHLGADADEGRGRQQRLAQALAQEAETDADAIADLLRCLAHA
jgi:hypothetical protein